MYYCESWTIKKVEHGRINAFELWCWRRRLKAPWTTRRSNQSILKEISPEYSLEGLILKLKLQYFGHLMRRSNSLEKTLMLRKIEGGRRGRRERMKWLHGITDSTDMSWWWWGKPAVLQSMVSQRVGQDWATELNWKVIQLTVISSKILSLLTLCILLFFFWLFVFVFFISIVMFCSYSEFCLPIYLFQLMGEENQ